MNEHLVKFWLFATHWTELDTFDNEEELNDEIELLHRQNLPTKVRQRTKKDGGEELVLYVKQADRDYAILHRLAAWDVSLDNKNKLCYTVFRSSEGYFNVIERPDKMPQ